MMVIPYWEFYSIGRRDNTDSPSKIEGVAFRPGEYAAKQGLPPQVRSGRGARGKSMAKCETAVAVRAGRGKAR